MSENYFTKAFKFFSKHEIIDRLFYALFFAALILFSFTYYNLSIINKHGFSSPSFIWLIVIDLIVFLSLIIVTTRKILLAIFKDYEKSRLRARIILMFSFIAAIPTIIVSVFSVYIFNYGLQAWLDNKVSTAINQSVKVANLYLSEHNLQLKNTALEMSNDLSGLYYDLIHNRELFNSVLSSQSQVRLIDEAIVFNRSTRSILAQTSLSFSLAFETIPDQYFEKADLGEAIEVKGDKGKIKYLIKLKDYHDSYLVIGRLIDLDVINYIDSTNGAAQQYLNLKDEIKSLQIKYAVIFLVFSLVLIGLTILAGSVFAKRIIRPIKNLVAATKLIQAGDLSIQVPTFGQSKDELYILTEAFNKMLKRIEIQQKDLALAERAMAWSDVAKRVAHEIKNPLTPILLSADMIEKKFGNKNDDVSLKKYTSAIKRHTKDIEVIVSEFVNFSRMPMPVFEECDLIELIRDQVEYRQLINEKIKFSLISNVDNLNFICDKTQINQVILNLIKNAEESFDGMLGELLVTIEICSSIDEVIIEIKDNGKGFGLGQITKATEPYFTTRSKGMGLGLSIVKKIVNDHYGNLEIENNKNGGASIKLIFDTKNLRLKMKR